MRSLDCLRLIGIALGQSKPREVIKAIKEVSAQMYPNNLPRREWAEENIYLFYDREIKYMEAMRD
jgi:hypothetical protein